MSKSRTTIATPVAVEAEYDVVPIPSPALVVAEIPMMGSISIPIPLGMHQQNRAFLRRAFLRLAELFMEGERAKAEGELLISVKMTNGLCAGKLRKRAEWVEELRRAE